VREPDFFVDEQRFGPYKFWHHQHLLKDSGSETEMTDIVHYAMGFGMLGDQLNSHRRWFQKFMLIANFKYMVTITDILYRK
jgi:ligand-binding SRPBCC domain-containing protein